MAGSGPPQASGPNLHLVHPKTRRLDNWIDAFEELTEGFPSPPLFKKWAAISAIAGALERKVWVPSRIAPLYPNLYTVLVGPPGGGKTVLTSFVKELWQGLDKHCVAADSLSHASLLDDLHDAHRSFIDPTTMTAVSFHSLKIAIDELGVLIPMFDHILINNLTAIFDCKPFAERKRGHDISYELRAPQINILGGCTPSFLKDMLPEGAWEQGFTARCLFCFSGETFPQPMFSDDTQTMIDDRRVDLLKQDLRIIGDLYGASKFTKEAADLLVNWYMPKPVGNNGDPRPDHPKLLYYCTRRHTHLAKLMLIASVARSDKLLVEADDFRTALEWLLQIEMYMPDIFKAMSAGGDANVMQEVWHFCYHTFMKDKKPIRQSRILEFIAQRAPSYSVGRILEVMVGSEILIEKIEPVIGKCYVPRGPRN